MNTVFDVLDLIKKYGGRSPWSSDFNDQCSLLATGKAAIIHQATGRRTRSERLPRTSISATCLDRWATPRTRPGSCSTPNQTIRVAKGGANLQAALAWLRWLTTLHVRQELDPGQDQAALPDHRSKGLQRTARPGDSEPLGRQTRIIPGTTRGSPRAPSRASGSFSRVTGGSTNRQQTLDSLDAAYTKIVNASK